MRWRGRLTKSCVKHNDLFFFQDTKRTIEEITYHVFMQKVFVLAEIKMSSEHIWFVHCHWNVYTDTHDMNSKICMLYVWCWYYTHEIKSEEKICTKRSLLGIWYKLFRAKIKLKCAEYHFFFHVLLFPFCASYRNHTHILYVFSPLKFLAYKYAY